MAFESRQTNDLVRITAAGGGFRLNASTRPTDDLIAIAGAARKGECHIVFIGMNNRLTDEIVQIAEAGKGQISFED